MDVSGSGDAAQTRPMKVADVLLSVGRAGWLHLDIAAIRAGAVPDGAVFRGEPVTPGFDQIVQPSDALSVMLVLEDGQVACGDCVDVSYAGSAGREPPFRPRRDITQLGVELGGALRGADIGRFRPAAAETAKLLPHGALRYGVTQALLHAVALTRRKTMAEILASEYGLPTPSAPTPIAAACQLGDLRQFDRMILKGVDLLPHSFFSSLEELGPEGRRVLAHVAEVRERVLRVGRPGYRPRLHVDMSGTLGDLFGLEPSLLVSFLGRMAEAAAPLELLVESPAIAESRAAQIALLSHLRTAVEEDGQRTWIVADEWCNTVEDVRAFADARAGHAVQVKMPDLGNIAASIEAVLYCKQVGMGVYLGGSANETDISARVTAHVALAASPDFVLAKPGLGGDEGLLIISNEMGRALALIARPGLAGAVRDG